MSVFSREALEGSPLADLHTIASEIGLDGYRRLRKADLVDAILAKQGGDDASSAPSDSDADSDEEPKRRTRSRGGRSRRTRDEDSGDDAESSDGDADPDSSSDGDDADADAAPARTRSRGGRGRSTRSGDDAPAESSERSGGRRRGGRSDDAPAERRGRSPRVVEDETGPEKVVEGTIEVLGNGSGFLRVSPPEPSDDDVYVSAAQIRRCELVGGDVVAGPVRPPRRSERYPSLVRVDTINSKSADEVAEGTPFDALPATFPTERFELGDVDATLKAIEWLTPIGRGSRAVIVGAARAGKTEALRRLAVGLGAQEGLEVSVVLAGARPEELADWKTAGVEPVASLTLGASTDAQTSAVERAVDTAKRIAARGGNAVVLIDGLDGVHTTAARRSLAAARNIVDGGSLTIIATASVPVGGETAVIALDVLLTSTGRLPALDLVLSGTVRPELLVGEAGASAIAQARADALS
jgi:transcription termination factor Rho